MEKDYLTQINESTDKLFHAMKQRVSNENMTRIRSVYEFASEAHKEQWCKTGEPYIVHPIAVARIVAEELELGANPVTAALPHDVLEDTSCTLEDIRKLYGNDVAFLVGVVTKQKKDKYEYGNKIYNIYGKRHTDRQSGCL